MTSEALPPRGVVVDAGAAGVRHETARLTPPAVLGIALAPIALMLALALPWLSRIDDPAEVLELLVVFVSCTAGITMACADGCRPLLLIFSTFFLCWLGIGPLYQLSHGAMAWNDDALSHDLGAVRAALLLSDVFLVVFFFAVALGTRVAPKRPRQKPRAEPNGWPVLVLSIVLLPRVVAASGGLAALFSSRATLDASLAANGLTLQQSGGAALAVDNILPGAAAVAAGLVFICRLRYRSPGRRLRADVVGLILSLGMAAIYCNPVTNTRFVALGAFGAMAVAWLRPTRRRAAVVTAVIAFVGAAFIYPLLSVFKTASGTQSASFTSGLKAFASPDFDGFQQIINTMSYVRSHGYGMGSHVLSALVYFVPRSIWQGKSEPASLEIAANRDYSFTNLSLPVHAEFYLDFGIAGVIVLAIGLGLLWGRLDERWINNQTSPLQFTLVSYFTCAQLGFIRGPLGSLSPVYYTTTLLIAVSFVFGRARGRFRTGVPDRVRTQ